MRSLPGSRTVIAGLVVCAAALTACGVTPQESAEPLPPNALPAPLLIPTPGPSASPSTSPSPEASPTAEPTSARLRLWFVQDDGLAAVESTLPAGAAPDLVLQALAIGPSPDDSEAGLRTVARDPLTGQPLVFVAPTGTSTATVSEAPPAASGPPAPDSPGTGPVTVTLTPAFSALPPTEQVLLLGQVVLSLAGAGDPLVSFVDDAGSPVAVPLPDGRLLDTPAVARDYASLIVRP